MPRTGTGPFPAQRSGFALPASQYGFMARDTQFSSVPYGGTYGPAGAGQYSLALPGGYFGPVAVPHQGDSPQDDPAQDEDRPAQWPLRTQLDLGALPGAVPCARLHARLVLTEWGQAQAGRQRGADRLGTDDQRAPRVHRPGRGRRPGYHAEGTAAAAGAAARAPTGARYWWRSGTATRPPPVPGQASLDGETGRGLLMVQAVSSRWGYYYPARQPRGTAPDERAAKVVWALVAARCR